MSVVVQAESDRSWIPVRGGSHGSGVSQASWQDDRSMLSPAIPLLNDEWELLSLNEKNQRLRIHIELMLRKSTWSGLSMQEQLATADPRNYNGYVIQLQAVCTANLRGGVDCVPYGSIRPGEVCGLGFPGQLWRPFPSMRSIGKHPSKDY